MWMMPLHINQKIDDESEYVVYLLKIYFNLCSAECKYCRPDTLFLENSVDSEQMAFWINYNAPLPLDNFT